LQLFETKRRTPAINLAALIDILFLLIIFFVVSSRIIGESGVKLVLPYDKSKSSVTVEMPLFEMSANGKLMLQGKPVSEKKLPEALRRLKNENVKGSLLMNIDRKVPHGRVVRLMSVVRESGFQHIVFGTQSAQPE
jgi:biopolymer transport protein ExbD|tara:strand:- start:979 stop:1386 length:408 start_codon:yes stop_codon:yes gene_type:complete